MANYKSLKTTINANVKRNGNQEITGQILNSVLTAMVDTLGTGYSFAGVATPATNPGTPDAKVFYIANDKGTYTHFGELEVTEDDVVVLYWDSLWHKESTGIAREANLTNLEKEVATKQNALTDTDGGYGQRVAELEKQGIASEEKLTELKSETKELITNQSVSGHPYYMIVDGYFHNYDTASKTVQIFSQYKGGKLKLYRVNGGERIFAKTDYRCPIFILKDFNFDESTYTKVDGYNLGFVAELTDGNQDVGTFEYIIPSDAKYVAITHYKPDYAPYEFLYINDHPIEGTILESVEPRKNGIFNIKINYVRLYYNSDAAAYLFNIYKNLSGIKDIYIPNRDVNKHYFISHIYSIQGDHFQFKIAYTEDGVMCGPSDYTVIFSVNILKSSISEDERGKIYVIEQNGIKLAVVFNELIQNSVNFGYYGNSISPMSNKDFVEIDWDYVDTHSMFTKQDILVSGTNIKTINSQSLLGSGNIEIEGVTDYSSLNNKPSINNVPLLGNKDLNELSIQQKLISGSNIKTINSQSILGNGNLEIEAGVADYNDLINKPTFKTINGQSVLGSGNIQSAGSITNSPDNITIEEVNSVLRLKDLSNSSFKYGYKHIYEDITITRSDVASWANSIVEIKGTITLTGSYNIDLPDNCILYFNGGSIKSGDFTAKLYPHSAKIIASPYQIFYGDVVISVASGNDLFYADVAYGEWFGAKGDGITPDGWAFTKLTKAVHCNKIQLLKKTYILERNINIKSCTLSGYGSTLKRYSKFADVLITEPTVVLSSDTHTLTVDTSADTYSNLEVGMGVFIMNKSTGSRQVVGGRWVISEINGESITIVGNSMDAVYDANTMCLVTGFSLVNLHGKNSRVEGIILDGLLDLTTPVYPLDRTPWEVDYTIGGGDFVENASIEDCYIINSLSDAIMVGGKNNIFSHNTILHSGANGIHLSGNYIVHIDNNYIFDSNLNPLTLHNEGAITYSNHIFEVTITNNIFDNCLAGIGSINSADDCKSIITGNIFRNFRTHGIQGNATNTSYGNITRQFIISNNRFIATQDDAASWETKYLYSTNISRQEATGYGILLDGYSNALWDSIIINNNNFEDCGVCIKYALSTMFSNNLIRIEHNFTSSTPNDIIQLINSNGAAQNNVIKSNSQSKTNCFKLTNSKALVSGNAYSLTGCTLSDTTYELLKDNTDIS